MALTTTPTCLSDDDDAQQWIGGFHRLVEVVVVVDWKEVSVDVGVAQPHVHPPDVVDALKEAVELLEVSRYSPLQAKAAVLCFKLQRKRSIR